MNEVFKICTVKSARLINLEYEAKSRQPQLNVQMSYLSSARVASAQMQYALGTFSEAMQAAMDASVWKIKEAMVEISTGALTDVDNCSR